MRDTGSMTSEPAQGARPRQAWQSLPCTQPRSMKALSSIPGKLWVSLAVLVPRDHSFLATADWTMGGLLILDGPIRCLVLCFGFVALRTRANELLIFCSRQSCRGVLDRQAEVLGKPTNCQVAERKTGKQCEGAPVTRRARNRVSLPEIPSRVPVPLSPASQFL